jgi:excinuclease UvrABC helicase subunit UvrB
MLEAFRKGELPVLINVNVLIQGVDLPDVGAFSRLQLKICRVRAAENRLTS